MKRIFIALTLPFISFLVIAQTSNQINFANIQRKIDRSTQDVENPKKNTNTKTWQTRGEVMLEVYDAMTLNISATPGIGIHEFPVVVGRPNQQIDEEVDGIPVTKMVMERVTFTFADGAIESWTFTNPLIENPLGEAYSSFLKAIELDDKGKAAPKIAESLIRLKSGFIAEGANCYTKKEYECAFESFKASVEIGKHPLINKVDTAIVYYTGLAAQLSGKQEIAIEFYKNALELGFSSNGQAYYNIYEALTALEREEEGLKYLEDGFIKVPGNPNVLYGLINYYISKGDNPNKVLEYIAKAKEAEPDNFSLYFAEGTLHDKLENMELAEKSYLEAIELNPKFFDAIFNLGALYYNAGVKYTEEANKVPARDFEKYDAIMAKADVWFRKSIPIMERAFEIDPNNKATVETLKNLYFRFRNDGEEIQKKLEKINEIWSNLK